jgi:hypothetical protein
MDVIGSDHETDSDAQGAEKKRDEDGKAEVKQTDYFMLVPDNHERIEGNHPVQVDVHPHRQYEKKRAGKQDKREVILKSSPEKKDESAARPEAQEGNADDEISEMIPVLYGEHLEQQNLVGNEGCGNKKDGNLNTSY